MLRKTRIGLAEASAYYSKVVDIGLESLQFYYGPVDEEDPFYEMLGIKSEKHNTVTRILCDGVPPDMRLSSPHPG